MSKTGSSTSKSNTGGQSTSKAKSANNAKGKTPAQNNHPASKALKSKGSDKNKAQSPSDHQKNFYKDKGEFQHNSQNIKTRKNSKLASRALKTKGADPNPSSTDQSKPGQGASNTDSSNANQKNTAQGDS